MFKYRGKNTRYVPRELTNHHKETRLQLCTELKQYYIQEGDALLDKIITSDEI